MSRLDQRAVTSMSDLSARLRAIIGDAEGARPFLCDGNPLTCAVALVGANPGTSTPFWEFWDEERGMDRRAWLEAHRARHGKLKRSRIAIEDFVRHVDARVVELNAYAKHSDRVAGLDRRDRKSDVLELMLGAVQPAVIFCAGADARRAVVAMSQHSQRVLIERPHFIYWGKESARAYADEVNRALRELPAPQTSSTATNP